MKSINGHAVAQALIYVAKKVEENKDYLCELDGEVGDGDHGVSMTIGMRAVTRAMNALPNSVSPAEVFQSAADAYANEVGATIGPLYEAAFAAAAGATANLKELNEISNWVNIYDAMVHSIQVLGKAEIGDKTMLDSFFPAVDHIRILSTKGGSLSEALHSTAKTALAAAVATKQLVPKKGRAARLGDRAIGYQDAGATSLAIVLQGFADGLDKA
ncbi:MAG: dihydroxyacetone kinase subunit L [Candidatus Nanopelagicaceae bacterium]|nr:dihydroxyacetone kinase subunit L [Candidatus Nanopelagicaceae bacterium]